VAPPVGRGGRRRIRRTAQALRRPPREGRRGRGAVRESDAHARARRRAAALPRARRRCAPLARAGGRVSDRLDPGAPSRPLHAVVVQGGRARDRGPRSRGEGATSCRCWRRCRDGLHAVEDASPVVIPISLAAGPRHGAAADGATPVPKPRPRFSPGAWGRTRGAAGRVGVYRWGITAAGLGNGPGVESAFFGGMRRWLSLSREERPVRLEAPEITPLGRASRCG